MMIKEAKIKVTFEKSGKIIIEGLSILNKLGYVIVADMDNQTETYVSVDFPDLKQSN